MVVDNIFYVSIYADIIIQHFIDEDQSSGSKMGGLTEEKKNPQALLWLCVRALFCMHAQFPQAWTALHSHAAIAPGLGSWGARGFWGHAEYGMHSTWPIVCMLMDMTQLNNFH